MGALNYQKIKNAKPKQKEYTLSDGAGLYLRVLPSGKKIFFYQSKKGGKLIKKTIGDATLISLENARKIAFDLRYNQATAYDRWNSTGIITELANEGLENFTPFGQGFGSMSQPVLP